MVNDRSEDHADVILPPPVIHIISIGLAGVIGYYFPMPLPHWVMLQWIGAMLSVAAIAITLWGMREFHASRNPVAPIRPVNRLMVSGPYRFTRNPLYLSLILLQLGLALFFLNGWMAVLLLPVVIIVHVYVVAREEAYLLRRFGSDYQAYQERVRRWI
ncbi:MAG: isoprenylcysteine carboxylmethyltransferase family protein [Candidatus Thiodiazotropha taylori]|nr:isoprenylcysteine carboxylmethyltransferase family protein [Candidatus Thiodiazotropha taylori]MCG8106211.1 isoprenylcysteine carboxylmethyltransferase family protein [Candidatus Thiodiazotropha taylori]MCG8110918.1 isoprenylcysteine carboxylmethyltransferase family protein [Candidatus Thiodiazotropha taylori]MCW4278547.1 isoprenylcysteine carboxylmethyltransferase family protein [Candidatus Thiodiazotropha taylori]MCW4283268.1 isoprenylcysteine carboxylmethyltransferase family protein [Cand